MSETLNPTSNAPESQPLVELEVGPVAHGGHCVARLDGRVIFVRHALPGERVLARITDDGEDAKFWRADAVEILDASEDRVPAAWPAAGPGERAVASSRTCPCPRSAGGRPPSSRSSSSASRALTFR